MLLTLVASGASVHDIAVAHTTPGWFTMRAGVHLATPEVLGILQADKNHAAQGEFVLLRTDVDKLGMKHYRYNQYIHSVLVEGSQLLVHERNGQVTSFNGHWVTGGVNEPSIPFLDGTFALEQALLRVPATRYIWQDMGAEAALKRLKKDSRATFFPKPELMLFDKSYSQRGEAYQLVYRFEIYASEPLTKRAIYIDAITGHLLAERELLCTSDVQGTAVTKYHSTQPVRTDQQASDQFRLRTTYGGGIETYDMNEGELYEDAVDFTDADNYWNNANAEQDDVAGDIHFTLEKTYDYFDQTFGWKSFDNQNTPLLAYVHYRKDYQNAFWNGHWMTFGDGDSSSYILRSAVASQDIVSHEMTHGVTEFSASLIYHNESGALNESFSDIFGNALERILFDTLASWQVGELVAGGAIRDMANPSSFGDPDTYKGDNWKPEGLSDNGGVHSNSGVQNFWFYLLTEGGLGNNDFGNSYNITPLGLSKAANIAGRSLLYYLVSTSQYADAREGSLMAARDLYGECSPEEQTTADAWFAVGVGAPISGDEMVLLDITEPISKCYFTANERVTIIFQYNGCAGSYMTGDSIALSFRVNAQALKYDTLVLTHDLERGDTIHYTFTQTANLAAITGQKLISAYLPLQNDPYIKNNSIVFRKVFDFADQNTDVGLVSAEVVSSCTEIPTAISLKLQFQGCDSLGVGATIPLQYTINNGAVQNYLYTLTSPIFPNETPTIEIPMTFGTGHNGLTIWTAMPADMDTDDDTLHVLNYDYPYAIHEAQLISFETPQARDSISIQANSRAKATIALPSVAANIPMSLSLVMTGGDASDGHIVYPDTTDAEIFSFNEEYAAKVCFCVDASNATPISALLFDLKQTVSPIYQQLGALKPRTQMSALRILVNGQQLGHSFRPETLSADYQTRHQIPLADFVGTSYELCFESRCGIAPTSPGSLGDVAYIDNIAFEYALSSQSVSPFGELTIQPNPATTVTQLLFQNPQTAQELHLYITDLSGRTVHQQLWSVQKGLNQMPLPCTHLTSGMYFVQLQIPQSQQVITQKLIIP